MIEFNVVIYRNIGSKFQSLITTLNSRHEPLSFNELHNHLISHEMLLKSYTTLPIANFAQANRHNRPIGQVKHHVRYATTPT